MQGKKNPPRSGKGPQRNSQAPREERNHEAFSADWLSPGRFDRAGPRSGYRSWLKFKDYCHINSLAAHPLREEEGGGGEGEKEKLVNCEEWPDPGRQGFADAVRRTGRHDLTGR